MREVLGRCTAVGASVAQLAARLVVALALNADRDEPSLARPGSSPGEVSPAASLLMVQGLRQDRDTACKGALCDQLKDAQLAAALASALLPPADKESETLSRVSRALRLRARDAQERRRLRR